MRTTTLATTAVTLAAASLPLAAAGNIQSTDASRPNILIILSDDMGYSDIGCYGSEIRTPALDALAARGLRFTQFYNSARCCPSRAALLTGLYAHQAGMGAMTRDHKLPGYTGSIRENCMTIAEMLRPAGYATYALGKWHVSRNIKDTPNNPLQRGFDHYYGMLVGSASYYDPSALARDNTLITPHNDPEGYRPANNQFYLTDAIGDNAIRYLEQHARNNSAADPKPASPRPFFMYVAFTAAHWPMQAFPEDIAKYKGVYDNGYNPIRQARHKRLIELGLLPPGTKLSPPDNTPWENIQNKEWEIRCMEVYAAIIDRMDQNIARIIAHLKTTGQLDNTVIFFMQDNGACAEIFTQHDDLILRWHNGPPNDHASRRALMRTPPNAATATYPPLGPDDLQTRSYPLQTRDGRPMRTGTDVMPGTDGTYIAYGQDWANVSNTPFREYKHWVHEGGISTPLIVHWPAGIPASLHNSLVRAPSHIIDIAATCIDLAGTSYPSKRGDTPLTPLAGVSLRPLLAGAPLHRAAPLCWEHEGNRAIRDGDWKLVAKGHTGPWELYDLATDRTELNDLAASRPDLVRRLSAAWEQWAIDAKAKPWPWDDPASHRSGKKSAKKAKK